VDLLSLMLFALRFLETFGICTYCEYCEAITASKQVICKIKGRSDLMIKCDQFKLRESLPSGTPPGKHWDNRLGDRRERDN
jgi:hypothetical protein